MIFNRIFFKTKNPSFFERITDQLDYRIEEELSSDLNENEARLREIFSNCSDLVVRKLNLFESVPAMLVNLSVLVDSNVLDEDLLKNVMKGGPVQQELTLHPIEKLRMELLPFLQSSVIGTMQDAVRHIVQGGVVVFVGSAQEAVSISIPNQLHRALEAPNTEAVIRGPQIGFVESLGINMALVRRRLKTPQLKMEMTRVGKISQNQVSIAYLEGVAPREVVEEIKRRIGKIEMDSVMDTNYIEELIRDKPYSPFPLLQATQRPDTTAAALIEGKVAILVDGSPMTLIAPITFWYGFQTVEDYYMHFIFATQLRWLRWIFTFLALTLPSFYVAVTTYHQEMIPTGLVLTLAASREIIPFPTMVETLMMEISFDALREAGIRLPRAVGQTISIVGALVIGQAAVQAGIISAPIVMVVSLTGIASFVIPHSEMSQAIGILRYPIVIMAGMFGLYGIGIILIGMVIHLVNLRSFGVYYMYPLAPLNISGLLDLLIRAPWRVMLRRQQNISKGGARQT